MKPILDSNRFYNHSSFYIIMKLNFNYKEMNDLKLAYFIFVINVITSIVFGYKSCYCNEIDNVFADTNLTLATRINFTLKMALRKYDGEKIWIIYSIEKASSINTPDKQREIGQNGQNFKPNIPGNNKNLRSEATINGLIPTPLTKLSTSDIREGQPTIKLGELSTHKISVILDYSLESGNPCLYQVFIHQMEQPFDLEVRPTFWLGEGTPICSINWLQDQFAKTKSAKLKQQIIAAIGVHKTSTAVVNFQKHIILGNNSSKLKNEAIGWLGKHNSAESIKLLTLLAVKQKDIQLRKKAICALSQVHNQYAHSVVIDLALKDKNQEIREEAIFWLSQIAEDYSLKTLNEIMTTEDNPEIKDCVVFAISQLPESKANTLLQRIAQSDPDAKVRNKARFWLNQRREQRLMDFFNELNAADKRRGSN